jgi:hypothetical protein
MINKINKKFIKILLQKFFAKKLFLLNSVCNELLFVNIKYKITIVLVKFIEIILKLFFI